MMIVVLLIVLHAHLSFLMIVVLLIVLHAHLSFLVRYTIINSNWLREGKRLACFIATVCVHVGNRRLL